MTTTEASSERASTSVTASITPRERSACRKQVAVWVRAALRSTRTSRRHLENALAKDAKWINNRLSANPTVALWLHEIEAIAKALGVAIPLEIASAARRAHAPNRALPRDHLDASEVRAIESAGTAAAEMSALLDKACITRKSRDRVWLASRFGVGGARARTLEDIGQQYGVTRERVRQVENRVLSIASGLASTISLPIHARIHSRVLEMSGAPLASVESELRSLLGGVALAEAVRFYEAVKSPSVRVQTDQAWIYGAGNFVKVVAQDSAAKRITSDVSTAAQKLYSYAGAGMVADVRTLVETHRKTPLSSQQVVRALDALPEIKWLDDQRRWFWFDRPELSALLRRAALILTLAKTPVDMETLYAGLVREGRRDNDSRAGTLTDPVPPSHVVHAILMRHPDFRRTTANAFTYAQPFDVEAELDGGKRTLVRALEQTGGIATLTDLRQLADDPINPVPTSSLAVYLYLCGFMERCGESLWKLRGRAISKHDRHAAEMRQPPAVSGRSGRPRDACEQWDVVFTITDAVRRNRAVYFRSADIPPGKAGNYVTADGQSVTLHQDRHGSRMTRLSPSLKQMIRDPSVSALRLSFDSIARTLTFAGDALDSPDATASSSIIATPQTKP